MKNLTKFLIKQWGEIYFVVICAIGLASGVYIALNPSPAMIEALRETANISRF